VSRSSRDSRAPFITDWQRAAATHVLAAAAFLVAAWVGLQWSVPEARVGYAWPAAGIGLALVLRWGMPLIPTLALASLVMRLAGGAPAIVSIVAAAGEALHIAVAAWLLHRVGGLHVALDRTRDVIVFVLLGAGVSTLIAAWSGVAGLVLAGIASPQEALELWWRWWLAYAVGVLVATPAIAWTRRPRELRLSSRRVEGAVTVGLLAVTGWLAFSGWLQRPASLVFVFFSYPLLLFVALRQSLRWTSLALILLASLIIGGTSARVGAFATGNLQLSMVVVWGYLLTTAAMALLLGAAVAEAHTASAETARLAAIVEATSDLVGVADPDGRVLSLNPAGRRMVGLAPDAPLDALRIPDFLPRWALELALTKSVPQAKRRGVWEGETALRHRDGHEIPVSQVIVASIWRRPRSTSPIARSRTSRQSARQPNAQDAWCASCSRLPGNRCWRRRPSI
jgi:PAS domain S-box-containing protein